MMLLLIVLGLTALCLTMATSSNDAERAAVRVMSFNIRCDNQHDIERGRGWSDRRAMVKEVLTFHRPDVLGVQEAFDHQLQHLLADLPGYASVGVGRDDGQATGEYSPILFRTDRFRATGSGTFWLSPTPEVAGSKGWDATLPRIATWAKLEDLQNGHAFLAVNTHLDHAGAQARLEGGKLLAVRARELAEGLPIVITGDFNSLPASATYATFADQFDDSRAISQSMHLGPKGTFGDFTTADPPAYRIDYIFVSRGVRVLREATLAHHWNGRHASDHFPIVADVVIG